MADLPVPASPPEADAPTHSPEVRTGSDRVVQPRLLVTLALVTAGIVWAVLRGLHFYGLTPLDVAYDLDQPPLLLVLVGGWLTYRSRGR